MARLGLTGDVMFGRGVDARWDDRDPAGVWGSMHERLRSLDGLVANLECCLSTRGTAREERTYLFRADPAWAVPALEAGGAACVSLANNHLLDFGPVALRDTLDALDDAGIPHPGAGRDRAAAGRPAVTRVGGLNIGVLAFTDQYSPYAAGREQPGTAYLDLDHRRPATRRAVDGALAAAYRAGADLVVATLHWGPNWVVRPSATQRAFARWLIDRGVDVVHGHSAHVIQGVEVYRGRPIVYDAGDFVDDYAVKPDLHNDRSFLFELVASGGRLEALELRPVEIVDERAERAGPDAAAWLRDRMRTLSAPFGTTVERAGRGLRIPLAEC